RINTDGSTTTTTTVTDEKGNPRYSKDETKFQDGTTKTTYTEFSTDAAGNVVPRSTQTTEDLPDGSRLTTFYNSEGKITLQFSVKKEIDGSTTRTTFANGKAYLRVNVKVNTDGSTVTTTNNLDGQGNVLSTKQVTVEKNADGSTTTQIIDYDGQGKVWD